ncbi:protein RecA [Anaplasma platys]|uniref:Protein RecA n=1 Tax=Anaplasma platys TaxID=949 RepID=A0A858PZG4_9RICK|nr:recombinase RecA [Anaplasma platys]QJC27942.1 protein RecA [Anaplasma platys]
MSKHEKKTTETKESAVDNAIAQIERAFGRGSIMRLKNSPLECVECVRTGSIALDAALGVGGLPRGRIIEIFGPESTGKTTLALHVIAESQRNGGTCAFIDAEHALDTLYARRLGVNVGDLIVAQPDTGEQALHIVEHLVNSGAVDVIVVDSVAALTPRAEIEGEMGDQHIGLQARLLSHALRKLTSVVSKANCVLIFINQIRVKIGVIYGNPEVTTGGSALKFYTSVRLDIRKISSIKEKDNIVGSLTRVKVVKNKVAPPFKQAEFDIMYSEGISKMGEILDMGVKFGFIEKSGAYYTMGSTKLGQGRENAKAFLKANPETAGSLEGMIRAHLDEIIRASDVFGVEATQEEKDIEEVF